MTIKTKQSYYKPTLNYLDHHCTIGSFQAVTTKMRFSLLFFIALMITSCATSADTSSRNRFRLLSVSGGQGNRGGTADAWVGSFSSARAKSPSSSRSVSHHHHHHHHHPKNNSGQAHQQRIISKQTLASSIAFVTGRFFVEEEWMCRRMNLSAGHCCTIFDRFF